MPELFSFAPIQNPWWTAKDAIGKDQKVSDYDRASFAWHPAPVVNLPREDAVHVIFGPRQIGKSTAVKLLIRTLLAEGKDPRSLFYYNCDVVPTRQELVQLVIDYRAWTENAGRTFFFLDEISSVSDWPYAIKWLIDAGYGKNATFFLTGSSSLSYTKAGEYLPGRRGKGKDVILQPLGFLDVFCTMHPEFRPIPVTSSFTRLKRFHTDVTVSYPHLSRDVERFFLSGGFPKIINEMQEGRTIREETVSLYQNWFKSALAKARKNERYGTLVISRLLTSLGTPTSYQAVSEAAGLGSHNTAKEYLEFLKESFFILEVPFFDVHQRRLILKKQRKYYPADPFLLWMFLSIVSGTVDIAPLAREYLGNAQSKGIFVETLLAAEFAKRAMPPLYYRSETGEIDFVFSNHTMVVESKYQDTIISSDVRHLRRFPNSLVLSRSTMKRHGGISIIPLSLFLICTP